MAARDRTRAVAEKRNFMMKEISECVLRELRDREAWKVSRVTMRDAVI